MAPSAREGVAGGSTAMAAACSRTTKSTASAASASQRLASAMRHQLRVLGRDHPSKRTPEENKGGE
ncbi:unnamed protein product [Ectocarpus sp. CCAP 1310/34]|nr:unnamed protein product [Ectocarpus sp. CCAP 1310/34]